MPIIDAIVLIAVFPTIMFLLNLYSGQEFVLYGDKAILYIDIVIGYIAIGVITGVYDFFKFNRLDNIIIIKRNSDVIFVKKIFYWASVKVGLIMKI